MSENTPLEKTAATGETEAEAEIRLDEHTAGNQQPEPDAQPEVEASHAEPAQEPAKAMPEWFEKRLDRLTWQRHQAERKAQELEQRLNQIMQQPAQGQAPMQQASHADAVMTQARKMMQQQDFDNRCNALYAKGKAEIPGFEQAIKTFGLLGGAPDFLFDMVSRLDNGHHILAAIASDPDKAAALIDSDPITAAAEVARMAAKGSKVAAPLSRAPEPTTSIQSQSSPRSSRSYDDMPMEDIEKAARQLKRRR